MLFVQGVGHKQRNQISLHFFERVSVVLQSVVEIAIVFRAIDAQIVADFMPKACE